MKLSIIAMIGILFLLTACATATETQEEIQDVVIPEDEETQSSSDEEDVFTEEEVFVSEDEVDIGEVI